MQPRNLWHCYEESPKFVNPSLVQSRFSSQLRTCAKLPRQKRGSFRNRLHGIRDLICVLLGVDTIALKLRLLIGDIPLLDVPVIRFAKTTDTALVP